MSGLSLKITIPLLAICLFVSKHSDAQSPVQYIARGDKELMDGYYQTAIEYYRMALRIDTNILEANFQSAQAYRKLRNYKRALDFYEATIDIDGQDLYPEAHFYKGLMQKQLGKYRMAMLSFQKFLEMYRSRDEIYRWARDEEVGCYWAIEHEKDTSLYNVLEPDSGLNTVHAELSPYLFDSNTIYYSSMRYASDEVKKSKPVYIELAKSVRRKNLWLEDSLDIPVGSNEAHTGNGTFNTDRSQFYYSRCTDLSDCQIWRTRKVNGSWEAPAALPEPVNVPESSNTQPAMAKVGDDEYLIFSSDRNGGKGGMDLWFVPMKQGEVTSRVRNMGNHVNTKGDEITPWFDAFDSTLYFASNRHSGFGGFDVIMSKGVPGNASPSENIGTGINSPADDYYMFMQREDSIGYFASNRSGGMKKSGNETCCNDVYKVIPKKPRKIVPVLPEIDSAAVDSLLVETPVEIENPQNIEELQTLLPISLYFHNDRPDPRTTTRTTATTYPQTVEEYINMRFDYIDAVNKTELDGTTKLQLGTAVQKFFDTDLNNSMSKLNKALVVLLKELEAGASITLAVKGYASPLADSDYNLNLTYRRIGSMENYIRSFEGGAFLTYINQEKLVIEKIPYGESEAADDVTDDLRDELGAIYSLDAARERRIEILRIELNE